MASTKCGTYLKLHQSILTRPYSLKVRGLNSLWYKGCSSFRKTALEAKFRLLCLLHHHCRTHLTSGWLSTSKILRKQVGCWMSRMGFWCLRSAPLVSPYCYSSVDVEFKFCMPNYCASLRMRRNELRHFRRRPCGALYAHCAYWMPY